jgi:SAM-dependent methyltransferase
MHGNWLARSVDMGNPSRTQKLDELMAGVRVEVSRRRADEGGPPLEPARHGAGAAAANGLLELRGDAETEGILARIRAELLARRNGARSENPSSREPTPGGARTPAAPATSEASFVLPRLAVEHPPELERRDFYDLGDFTALHDAAFLKAAYRGLLGRVPERDGLDHYLGALRSGRLGKIDILGRLRYSAEGRARGVRVQGLLRRYLGRLLFRVPLAGALLRSGYYMWRAPALARSLDQLQTHAEERARLGAVQTNLAIEAIEQALARAQQSQRDMHARLLSRQQTFEASTGGEVARVAAQADELLSSSSALRDELAALRASTEPGAGIPDEFYAPFEDLFRGTREDIMGRVRVYLPTMREAGAGAPERPILDLGCGRGEWLQVLRDEGLSARGIDLNAGMIERSRAQGLEVDYGDAIVALRSTPSGSLGAVTAFHLVEHIPFGAVVTLFDEALRCLRPGGLVLFETPNPENVVVGACNFYYDPTHRNPIPPDALRYLAEARGFADARIHRLHPPAVTADEGMDALPERVRAAFLAAQDYSIIARKP